MPYLERGPARLYYETHGTGLPLVFLHGVGGNHASWFHQIATFAGRYRVVVYDARGFGNSTDPEGLGRDGFADDLLALLDVLEIPNAVLVCQSMGGGTGLTFTCGHPERVAGLLLADTLMGFEMPAEVANLMAEVTAGTSGLTQAERVVGPTFRTTHPAETMLYLQLASFNAVNVRSLKGRQPMHHPEDLGATGVPVLFLVGSEDVLFPPRAVRAVQARVTGSTLVEIDRTGHSAYFERPEVFDHLLLNWLADLPG
jgi:pimeloyl-ACP methyl ester carboxylesterase